MDVNEPCCNHGWKNKDSFGLKSETCSGRSGREQKDLQIFSPLPQSSFYFLEPCTILAHFRKRYAPPPSVSFFSPTIADNNVRAVLQRTLRSLISSFTDMAVLTNSIALVPLEALKCQLLVAKKHQTVQNINYLSG